MVATFHHINANKPALDTGNTLDFKKGLRVNNSELNSLSLQYFTPFIVLLYFLYSKVRIT